VPVEGLVAALRETGVPCTASSHAGTFLCNQVLYQTLAHADRHELGVRAAFVHVPEPGPAGGRLDLDLLVRGITAAVRYAAALPRPGGGEAGRGGTRRASKRPPAARPRSRNSR
jgi:pyrrolidone-carboxylate peptidase